MVTKRISIEKENPDLLINDYKEFMEYIKENELC